MPGPGPLELLSIVVLFILTYGIPLLIIAFFVRRMIRRNIDPLRQELEDLKSELQTLKKKIE